MQSILFFIVAGLLEIGGGYLMWLWLREKWAWWVGALGALIILRLCWTRCAVWTRRRGTIAPWAIAASLPFAPEMVLPALDYCIHQAKLTELNPYGFKASFNPTYSGKSRNPHGWVSPWHYGLNQRPIILMIENYQTELLWQLMRNCPYIVNGLRRAGFGGG